MEKAAQLGNLEAQADAGDVFMGSRGFDIDYKRALKWNIIAAERGDNPAAYRAGCLYEKGLGTPQDYKKAVKYYLLGAKNGDSVSQKRLAAMYDQGLTDRAQKPYEEANRWRQAAVLQVPALGTFSIEIFSQAARPTIRVDLKHKRRIASAADLKLYRDMYHEDALVRGRQQAPLGIADNGVKIRTLTYFNDLGAAFQR